MPQPRTVDPIVFPIARRLREVRQAAEELNQMHGEAAVLFWKARIRSIADPLAAAGIPEDEVRRQVFAFQDAVQRELQALALDSVG
ncbi:MAG: hypothetical protein JWM58_122 [Rhizobium sp.]|nr:hypothetical protein [Rhizobium sp.]